MLERLHIKNFRALRDLEMSGLARINLIGGRNNSGKTSLLEALFLLSAAGNPRALLNTNLIRSDGAWDRSGDAAPWRELFNGLDEEATIEIAVTHMALGALTLSIATEWPTTSQVSIGSEKRPSPRDSSSAVRLSPELALRYSHEGKDAVTTHLHSAGNQARTEGAAKYPVFDAAILLSRAPTDQGELANRLGELTRLRRDHLLLDALRVVEPRLQSIKALPGRDEPVIWCDIGLPELAPLSLIGEGMINLTEIVLSIEDAAGGVVLVDEIENGFHHSILPDVWKVLDRATQQSGTQIFATTHSYECFEAAQKALDPDAFRYHRLDMVEGGVRAVTYDPDIAAAAVKHYFEVR